MRRFFPSTIRDSAPPVNTDFVFTVNTANTSTGSSTSTQFNLPLLIGGVYNFDVDWGDSTSDNITVWNAAETTHTYGSTGTYTITITGQIDGWGFNNTGDRLKILNIQNWGTLRIQGATSNALGAFYGCANMDITATDLLDLSLIGSSSNGMNNFFRGCTSLVFNSSVNDWDVSLNTSLLGAFASSSFNQPIGNWNTSSLTNLGFAFFGNTVFNQDISGWDVSNVTTLTASNTGCFFGASAFNQPIGDWNISGVGTMYRVFRGATSFNQPLTNWSFVGVSDMREFLLSVTMSVTNYDFLLNRISDQPVNTGVILGGGGSQYSTSAVAGRALLTRANATVAISNAVNNGSGLIRITSAAHGRTTGDKIYISNVVGTTEAIGAWIVTVIDATTVDLQGSTFTNTYTSGGTLRTGYGWTITDLGLI